MYDKILEALKTKFKGVPGKVLEMRAKNISKTVTEEDGVQPAVDGVTFEDLFEAYGDSKVTKATETAGKKAIEKFRKDHNLDENGKPIASGGDDDDDDDDPNEGGKKKNTEKQPEWAKRLEERLDKFENGKKADERATLISGKLKAAKIPDALHKRFSVADDADDDAIDTAITEFKQELNDLGISGLKEPGGGGGSDSFSNDLEKWSEEEGEKE